MSAITVTVIALILARWGFGLWLSFLNQRNVQAHADKIPEAFAGVVDEATYARSVRYTLARARFGRIEETFDTLVLLLVLFSGLLPTAFQGFTSRFGASAWSMAGLLFAIGLALALAGLPFSWYAQFRLEEQFGFNTTTQKLWWQDRVKGLLLAFALGYPLLVLVLKLVDWMGAAWWLWAWGALLAFQLLMLVLAPIIILPLFNKFTPLPEGTLRERLLALGARTQFTAKTIQVMDGSKRSRHSNAFFTGFGRFRKIVLFDTLMQQLSEGELEAVLAHEIGHYKKKHIPKMLIWSAVSSLAGFYVLSVLSRQEWFYHAFGFATGNITPALLLFVLLSGLVTFWLAPLGNYWSRKHEYEADAYAAEAVQAAAPLIGALRKLNEKNLSNLTPHPLYSGFYYSHPTLLERENALKSTSAKQSDDQRLPGEK